MVRFLKVLAASILVILGFIIYRSFGVSVLLGAVVIVGAALAIFAYQKENKEEKRYKPKWWLFGFVVLVFFLCLFGNLNAFAFPLWGVLGYWLMKGVIGGIIFANKKLRGGGWILILLLLPIVLIPMYLLIMGILGEWAYAWGRNTLYSKKKCSECKAWIPREAIRCSHCGQVVNP
jgi:hypothetical protein